MVFILAAAVAAYLPIMEREKTAKVKDEGTFHSAVFEGGFLDQNDMETSIDAFLKDYCGNDGYEVTYREVSGPLCGDYYFRTNMTFRCRE